MTALPSSGAFTMVDPTHVAELGAPAAVLYARIVWRTSNGEGWRASRGLLSQETGLSLQSVRTAVKLLRDREWVTATRASSDDATLVWAPVLPAQGEKVESTFSDMVDSTRASGGINHVPDVVEPTMSSCETDEDCRDTADAAEPTPLFVVPDPEPEQPVGPPKTAQTLVARWCDGYRAANGGRDAPKAFLKRVAGQARNLAKASGDDHDEWVLAWNASYAAGQAGNADMTRHLVTTQRPSTARRNVFADAALGGPDAEAMARITAHLNPPTRPALETRR